jgi:hypothetical protein
MFTPERQSGIRNMLVKQAQEPSGWDNAKSTLDGMWKEFQTWMAKDPKNKQLVTNTLIGGGAGGLLSLANAINANQYRDPEDRTSVIGQGLIGALMGGTAGGAGTYAWQRLGPKGKGKGKGEGRENTTTENLRDAGLATGGAALRNLPLLGGLGTGAYSGYRQIVESSLDRDKIKDIAEKLLNSPNHRLSPNAVTNLTAAVNKYKTPGMGFFSKARTAKDIRKILPTNVEINQLPNPWLRKRTAVTFGAPLLGWLAGDAIGTGWRALKG